MNWPQVIGHRGAAEAAPENTLESFRAAKEQGVGWVEFDAKLTADNKVFLLHDDDVDRTSNGHGPAAQKTYAELVSLDAGSWFGPAFAGERMPTLEAVARRCIELGISANVEIKPCPGRDEETGHFVALAVRQYWSGAPVAPLLSSFSEIALEAARLAAPELARGLLVGHVPDDWAARAARLECVSVHFDHRHIEAPQLQAIRAAGYRTLAYTVNEPDRAATLRAWGVDAICTDRIDLINPGSF